MIIASKSLNIPRYKLAKIPVPEREGAEKTWKPIQHGKLADTVYAQAKVAGLEVVRDTWYVNPKKTIMWGAIDLKPGGKLPDLQIGQDASFSMGIRHGNGGEYAVSFAVGARVAVCDNGMFAGDFVLKKRHTPDLDLKALVDTAFTKYIEECETLEKLINGWRDSKIDDRDAAYLILRAHSEGHVNFRYLEDIERNWRKPPHEEFGDRTAWSLYNAFTETAKILTPPRQLKLLTGLRRMFDSEFAVGVDAYTGPQTVSLN